MKNKYIFTYEPLPTEKNIEYALQRLLLALVESANYDEYSDSQNEYKMIIDRVINWIKIYVNEKDFKRINIKEVLEIRDQLYDLDNKYLSKNGLYAEDSYERILQFQIIVEKYLKKEKQ